ncbi:MAG: RNA polymerase factor sigma-70 [Steroidobacteraceae bacterium]
MTVTHPSGLGAPAETPAIDLHDPAFLNELRSQMLKFAILQMSDEQLAEDAVQEALIGALKNARSFGGRAAFKTWMFAILKNKISDTLRQRHRLVEVSRLLNKDQEEVGLDQLFDNKGFWNVDERPADWGDPEQSFRDGQFWTVFETCLDGLPPKHAQVFMMREFIELDTEEICKTVGITVSNLHVLLHRARLRLRECLENKWHLGGANPC